MTLLLASTFETFEPKLDHVKGLDLASKNVLCIPTAAYGEENYDWLEDGTKPIQKRAKNFTEFDITNKSEEDINEALKAADIIYVTGGNTYYLLEKMKACGFINAVNKFLENGGAYIGCSAGAVIACPKIDFIGDMDDKSKADLKDYNAIGLIDFMVMPHIDHESYGPKAAKIIEYLNRKQQKIIGLKDDQALLIEDNYMIVY